MQREIKSTKNNLVNKLLNSSLFKLINKIIKSYLFFIKIIAKTLNKYGVTANIISVFGFAIGMFTLNFLSYENYFYALIFILANRFFDSLDGAIARISKITPFGIFLDTLLDYIFYGAVILGFGFIRGEYNSLTATFWMFSLFCVACTMLSYAIVDKERKLISKKNPFYLKGYIQGGETFIALVISCLFPSLFPIIATIAGVLCLIKALGISATAYYNFVIMQKDDEGDE